jgi:hypothetical protein
MEVRRVPWHRIGFYSETVPALKILSEAFLVKLMGILSCKERSRLCKRPLINPSRQAWMVCE